MVSWLVVDACSGHIAHGDRALSIYGDIGDRALSIYNTAISKLSLLVNIDTRIMRGQVSHCYVHA